MSFIERHLHYTIHRKDAFMEVHAVVEDSNPGEMQTFRVKSKFFFFVHLYLNFSIERKISEKGSYMTFKSMGFFFS